jgi:kexin
VPVLTQPPIVDEEQDSSPKPSTPASSSDNLFPHPFPTFGVSKGTQKWVYGSIVLIIIFLIGLCAFLIYMRRKKRWMNRDDYGFEMIDHDDNDDAAGANGAAAGKKGRRQRAGELYDAFAEGSDDEAEPFDLGEDSEDEHDDGHLRKGEKHADERYRDSEPLRQGTDVE